MVSRNIKLVFQYDGTAYRGWQVQPGQPTVCGVIQGKLGMILNREIRLNASSRTDSGVHARYQVANFTTDAPIRPDKLARSLNAVLPEDISCRGASEAPAGFNARFASTREYSYTIRNSRYRSPFDMRYSYFYPGPLDAGLMAESALFLLGAHDFSAFHSATGDKINRVRNILKLDVRKRGCYIRITAEANGFLTHMVRIIAGTLLEAGRGRFRPEEVRDIMASGDRGNAGPTLPPCGLCLMKVKY